MCLVLLQHSDIKDGLGKSDGLLTAVPLRHVGPNYRGRGDYVGGVRETGIWVTLSLTLEKQAGQSYRFPSLQATYVSAEQVTTSAVRLLSPLLSEDLRLHHGPFCVPSIVFPHQNLWPLLGKPVRSFYLQHAARSAPRQS